MWKLFADEEQNLVISGSFRKFGDRVVSSSENSVNRKFSMGQVGHRELFSVTEKSYIGKFGHRENVIGIRDRQSLLCSALLF